MLKVGFIVVGFRVLGDCVGDEDGLKDGLFVDGDAVGYIYIEYTRYLVSSCRIKSVKSIQQKVKDSPNYLVISWATLLTGFVKAILSVMQK